MRTLLLAVLLGSLISCGDSSIPIDQEKLMKTKRISYYPAPVPQDGDYVSICINSDGSAAVWDTWEDGPVHMLTNNIFEIGDAYEDSEYLYFEPGSN